MIETKIPLILKLRRTQQKEVAKAQDIITDTLFNTIEKAVMHGGTSIWRCYKGNRFSEDIDVYLPKDKEKIELFFLKLKEKGFIQLKKKISDTSIFSSFEFNRINVKFEAIFKDIKGILKNYEKSDSNLILINTLSAEELIKEKIQTYLSRLKIRDLYDVFYLLRYVSDKNKIKKELQILLKEFKNPLDEKDLKILIIEGLTPNVNSMLNFIQGEIK